MRLIILLISIVVGTLVSQRCFAQELFTRVYGGNSYDFGKGVIQTPDNGYLIAGTTGSFGVESGQIMLIKTGEEGYEEWRKYYGGPLADQAESMQISSDGNLLIAGSTETVDNSYQFYALKLNMAGDTIWTRTYGGQSWDLCRKAVALDDGGFALFGQTFSSGSGDFFLVRIDSEGDTLWTKTYGGSGLESGEAIDVPADGGYFLAGYTESFGAGKADMYVIKTDENGDTLWTKTFGGAEDDFCYGIGATADSGYVMVGGTYSNTAGVSDMVIQKEGADLTWVQYASFAGEGGAYRDVIIEPLTGNVTAIGNHTGGDFGKIDGRIIRYGADGIWNGAAKDHGSLEDDFFYDVKLCSDNGYIIVGNTQGYLNRFDDVFLVKTGNNGLSVDPELGVNEIILGGKQFGVVVGPNPFTTQAPSLYIQNFDELERVAEKLQIRLYNAFGQEVYQQLVTAGTTTLETGALSNGIYTFVLSSAEMVLATGKAVKLN